MANPDQILSIVAAILFGILMLQFGYRYFTYRWGVYKFILIFCVIRVVAYALRSELDVNGFGGPGSDSYLNVYITVYVLLSIGVVFVLKLISQLFGSILPKVRHLACNDFAGSPMPPDHFEQLVVARTALFVMPPAILVIAGSVLSNPTNSPSDQNLGQILRKVGMVLLMALGAWYLWAAWTYYQRFPTHRRAFSLALISLSFFVVSLGYKLIYTFYPAAQTATAAYFILSPLMELAGLCVLIGDIQTAFLGHMSVEDVESQATPMNGQYQQY